MLRVLEMNEIASVRGGNTIVYFDCQAGNRIRVTQTVNPDTLELTRTYEFTGESCSTNGPYIGDPGF